MALATSRRRLKSSEFGLIAAGDEAMTEGVTRTTLTHPTDRAGAGAISAIRNPQSAIPGSAIDKAAHDMEGYFVGMLLKQMHESASKGGLFDSGSESTTYREMFDEAV